jgi:hypothetical protein
MKRLSWKLVLLLIILSIGVYTILYLIFSDPVYYHYLMSVGLALVPIEMLLATLLIERGLKERERRALLNKLNMVFF